jgi:hypothetical protein
MTLKQKSILYILGIFLLSSCGSSKKHSNTHDKNDKATEELASKYNAVTNWDTLSVFTSRYQKMFIEQNKLMLFKGRAYDIIKEDSNYIVKVLDEREDASRNFLALIIFTPQQLEAIYTTDKSTRGVFVINVSKITSSNPSIKEDEGSNGEDSYTYTHLSDDTDHMITIFKGKVVDCYFEKFEDSK